MVPNDIKTVGQLKGKKVGVSQFGDSSFIGAQLGLRRMGLDTKDVTYVAVGSSTNRAAALMNGAVQGGVVSPPMDLELGAHGLHPLFSLAALKIPAVNVTITARRPWLLAHRDVAQRYVDAIVAGIERQKSDKALTLDVLRQYYKIDDPRELEECYAFYAKVTPTLPYPRAELFTEVLKELANTNEKVRGFDVSKILDDSFVRRAAADLKIRG
jgi:ABC-type nitrate/sulfonate/bicarbonate transport system substrate-binding protein